MVLVRRLAYVASLLLVPACGQKVNNAPPSITNDGGAKSGDDLAKQDAAPAAKIDMAGFNQAGAPTIVITAPTAGAEIHNDSLPVTATITSPSGALIQASSVQVTVAPPGGAVSTAPLTLTTTANVYSGTVSLPDDSSGDRTFIVTASDVNGLTGSATGTFVHDHGPVIAFVAPTSSAAPVKGTQTLSVEFTVTDTLHPITDLSQVKAGIRTLGDIALQSVAGATPFTAFKMVDLKAYGTPALDGNQLITAQATNSAGTTVTATQPFVVDNTGPVVTINSPTPANSFVSGVVTITVTVADAQSNIDDSTVVAVWGGDSADFSVPLTKTTGAGTPSLTGTYSGQFDVRKLGTSYVEPALSVRASDVLGNQGEGVNLFFVDNTRPWVTMNQLLQVRVEQLDPTTNLESCSALFSPIGSEVAVDGNPTPLAVTLRARVEDHGNSEPGIKLDHVSGIDEDPNSTAVTMYVIPDDGKTALAVNTDATNTYCDDVNPELLPTTDILLPGEALAIPLVPIAGTGTPDQRATGSPGSGVVGVCDEYGYAGAPAYTGLGICDVTPLPYNIGVITLQPEIFTLPPVASGPLTCVGTQLDSQNHNLRGPICVVTRAVDKSGNVAVSYPLHLCVIDPANPNNCNSYAGTAGLTSHCTGVYNTVTQQLVPGATCTLPPTSGTTKATFANGDIIKQLN